MQGTIWLAVLLGEVLSQNARISGMSGALGLVSSLSSSLLSLTMRKDKGEAMDPMYWATCMRAQVRHAETDVHLGVDKTRPFDASAWLPNFGLS